MGVILVLGLKNSDQHRNTVPSELHVQKVRSMTLTDGTKLGNHKIEHL